MWKKCNALFVTAILVIACTGCVTIVKTGEEAALTGEVAFSAGDNVAEIWESQALPLLDSRAVELALFLTESDGNLNALADQYGCYSMGDFGELSYTVKGIATVKEVVTDKKAGYLVVELDGYSGAEIIKIQVGTVYKGSAVRDSLDFIRFEDYKNQVEYAAVSQSIHDVVQQSIISNLNMTSLTGQKVNFVGCFTVDKAGELLITPVRMTLV